MRASSSSRWTACHPASSTACGSKLAIQSRFSWIPCTHSALTRRWNAMWRACAAMLGRPPGRADAWAAVSGRSVFQIPPAWSTYSVPSPGIAPS